MFNLFKTYNKAKDVFVSPKIKFHFGLWKNSPGLPVWRRGAFITLGKSNTYYEVQNRVFVKTGIKTWEDSTGKKHTTDVYEAIRHNLPNDLKSGNYVWNRDIRKKLRKWGLGWLKPIYILPTWLAFHIFDFDVCYKYKYDDIRYEFPPQFTIVFFGLAFTIMLKPPLEDEYDSDSHYWESLLNYLYQDECQEDIRKTVRYCGQWTTYDNDGKIKYFQLRKSHIKPEYHEEYDKAVQEYYFLKLTQKNNDNT